MPHGPPRDEQVNPSTSEASGRLPQEAREALVELENKSIRTPSIFFGDYT